MNLCALQTITPKAASRNQLLNDLLAIAIDQIESSLPDSFSDNYQESLHHHEKVLKEVLATQGHL